MSEQDAITKLNEPHTVKSLTADFHKAGLTAGMTVIVHSSLSSLGWVCGGPVAVVQALMEVLTPEGNLIMPTHSTDYSDPAYWQNPAVPKNWWERIRREMPAFDPQITPSRGMGVVPEIFRTFPGVQRSYHPNSSFAAWGKQATFITEAHSLDLPFGPQSPLGKIYDLNGFVFLLGVGHGSNTSLHLAESMIEGFPQHQQAGPILENGKTVWKNFTELQYNSAVFRDIGHDFEKSVSVKSAYIGPAETKLLPQRPLVDFAVKWIRG